MGFLEAPGPFSRFSSQVKILGALLLLLGLAGACFIIFGERGLYRLYQLHQERDRLERQNAVLQEENIRLASTIARIRRDPEMMQDLIRRELNFVREHDLIFELTPRPQAVSQPRSKATAAKAPRKTARPKAGRPQAHAGK